MRRVAALAAGIAVLVSCASATGQAVPSPPSVSDQTTKAKHKAKLAWKPSPGGGADAVRSYNIYRAHALVNKQGKLECKKKWEKIGSTTAPATQFTDEKVAPGKAYCYAVTSVTARGESWKSDPVKATIPSP